MKAQIGTISHATLRPQDLIPAFLDELRRIDKESADELENSLPLEAFEDETREYWASDDAEWWNSEECSIFLNEELFNALDAYAPPYCYFGALDGDGSDFGFWPCMEAVEELPKFADGADVPDDIGEDYCIVNDHGNLSLYNADHDLIWDIV